MFPKGLARAATRIAILCAVLAPLQAIASATLEIVQGSGELQTLQTAITVGAPEAITFRWSTDQANATGGTWNVTVVGSPQVLASGESSPAPKPGHIASFTIPASGAGSFLSAPAPSPAVTYSITITPHDAMNNALGSASAAVTVTYGQQPPPQPVQFGRNANFPDLELIQYSEQIGQVPLTQLLFANATVIVRAVNNSKTKTDPFNLVVNDFNALMRQTDPALEFAAIKPGVSITRTIHLTANLQAPKSQLPQEQQMSEWQADYRLKCGVDLRATLDWAGPQAQAPMNDHAQQYLYLGYGNSKPWDEGHPVTTQTICDTNNCINLNEMVRYVYHQLACKVVGYAFFVGDRTSGSRSVFTAFGHARTSLNGTPVDFSPDTTMQIASASKVLTSLAGMRVFNGHLDDVAYKSFPSNWTMPQNSIVENITFREFLSQTSGVQQYYPGNDESFATLQTFYTQTLANPNAPYSCPGAPAPPNNNVTPPVPAIPRFLPNPIISNNKPCYSNANFAIMRLAMPRFAGTNSNDPTTLANRYVQQVQQNVFAPLNISNVACKPSGKYAFPYVYPGTQLSGDFGDLTLFCGSWGWYVSVRDYATVLVSLNSADQKILSNCQFLDMETNPSSHPVGWDINIDRANNKKLRWLEKNGADGTSNGSIETTSVGIYLGSPGVKKPTKRQCTPSSPGVAGVLFLNSDISGQPKLGASNILTSAFEAVVKPKP